MLADFIDLIEEYRRGTEGKENAEAALLRYKNLLQTSSSFKK